MPDKKAVIKDTAQRMPKGWKSKKYSHTPFKDKHVEKVKKTTPGSFIISSSPLNR